MPAARVDAAGGARVASVYAVDGMPLTTAATVAAITTTRADGLCIAAIRSFGRVPRPVGSAPVQIRIEASELPGRACGPSPDKNSGYDNIYVGVQKRGAKPDDLLGMVAGDAPNAVWTLECDMSGTDVKGRYIQGRPGDRFIYLSWGTVDRDGAFEMFRRAKLMLDVVDAPTLRAARRSGTLVGRLGLTDARGNPLCAAVRPPAIEWSV